MLYDMIAVFYRTGGPLFYPLFFLRPMLKQPGNWMNNQMSVTDPPVPIVRFQLVPSRSMNDDGVG